MRRLRRLEQPLDLAGQDIDRIARAEIAALDQRAEKIGERSVAPLERIRQIQQLEEAGIPGLQRPPRVEDGEALCQAVEGGLEQAAVEGGVAGRDRESGHRAGTLRQPTGRRETRAKRAPRRTEAQASPATNPHKSPSVPQPRENAQ